MLKQINPYIDKVNVLLSQIGMDPKYKFLTSSDHQTLKKEHLENDWSYITYVSVDSEDEVIGLFEVSVMRPQRFCNYLMVINFREPNMVFSRDMFKYIHQLLFYHNFYKIRFKFSDCNPASKWYKKLIEKYNVTVVGKLYQEFHLPNGSVTDGTLCEIIRDKVNGGI